MTLHQTFSNSKLSFILERSPHLVNFDVRVQISQEQGSPVRDGVRGVRVGGVVPEPDTRELLLIQQQKVSSSADSNPGRGLGVREGSLSLWFYIS